MPTKIRLNATLCSAYWTYRARSSILHHFQRILYVSFCGWEVILFWVRPVNVLFSLHNNQLLPRKIHKIRELLKYCPTPVIYRLFSSLLHRRKLLVLGLGCCKIKIPPLISVVMCFLIPLSCWLTWLLLKPASAPHLAAIMDNKYCPEKRKPGQGWTLRFLLAVGEVTFLVVSLPQSKPGES